MNTHTSTHPWTPQHTRWPSQPHQMTFTSLGNIHPIRQTRTHPSPDTLLHLIQKMPSCGMPEMFDEVILSNIHSHVKQWITFSNKIIGPTPVSKCPPSPFHHSCHQCTHFWFSRRSVKICRKVQKMTHKFVKKKPRKTLASKRPNNHQPKGSRRQVLTEWLNL